MIYQEIKKTGSPKAACFLVHLSYRLSNDYREPERLRSVSRMVRVVSLIIPWLKNRVTRVRYLDIKGVDYISIWLFVMFLSLNYSKNYSFYFGYVWYGICRKR